MVNECKFIWGTILKNVKQPCGHKKLKFLFAARCLGKNLLKTSARGNKFHRSVIIKRTYKFYEIYHLPYVSNTETERKFEIVTDKFTRESSNKHCGQQ
jgi:hypothetical protein